MNLLKILTGTKENEKDFNNNSTLNYSITHKLQRKTG